MSHHHNRHTDPEKRWYIRIKQYINYMCSLCFPRVPMCFSQIVHFFREFLMFLRLLWPRIACQCPGSGHWERWAGA